MDTTETYIKMCEKAEEIQANRPLPSIQVVDEKLVDNWKMVYFDEGYLIDNRGNWWADTRPDTIWLPRQDQLQEMVLESEHYGWLPHLCQNFAEFLSPYQLADTLSRRSDHWAALGEMLDVKTYVLQFTSMEQLWFAFVMKENHNKMWSGEGWI